jgi:RNA polymerase sigma-70 factor, ECF subfamily
VRELGDAKVRDLVGRYARAMAAGDVDGVLDVLADDATWSMPPMPAWYRRKEAIAAFLRDHAFQTRWRHLDTWSNGQPALGCYGWDEGAGAWVAFALDVLTLDGDRIVAVTGFVDPRAVALCGLPDRLPGGAAA